MTTSGLLCLMCNAGLDVSSCANIFYTSLPRSGEVLASFVTRVLRVAASDLRGSYVCSQCHGLFQMLEQAQRTVVNIRCEILKIYRNSERRKNTGRIVDPETTMVLDDSCVREGKTVSESMESRVEETELRNVCMEDSTRVEVDADLEGGEESGKNCSKRMDCKELVDVELFEYNNSIDTRDGEIPKAEEKNYASTMDSNKTGLNFTKPVSVFTENKLQTQNIVQSMDFGWKGIEENVAEVKENSESNAETELGQLPVALKPGRLTKFGSKSSKYSCPTCGKKWKTSGELKTHVKTHSTLRPYMCEKCGKAYKHKHALEVHVGMHNGINPFQCTFCKKCFTQKGALVRHLPMHTGETPYQCELCGKRFVHHTSYNMHRLSHSGKKSYKCHVCDLSLLSTSHLKRHMRVHTGEKPYSCTLCGKRFAERYNLFAHQKIHDPSEMQAKKTKEALFKCSRCNFLFEKKQNLEDHSKKCREVFDVRSKTEESSKKEEGEEDVLNAQTWVQVNRSKLDAFENQTKFVLLQNPLSEIDESSFAVAFSDHKVSLENANYNTSLRVIIEPDTSVLTGDHLAIDKTHM